MDTQYFCGSPQRRRVVTESNTVNGIDYLEVDPADQTRLLVYFLHDLPGSGSELAVPSDESAALNVSNLLVEGGVRIAGIRVTAVSVSANLLTVKTDQSGDFSNYTLRLVLSLANQKPPGGFDRQLSSITFNFKANCPSDFDCRSENECLPEVLPEPEIDYQAKDYNSFVRLIMDRMSVIMPGWRERHAADLQVALVELMAYTGDYLSYYQDAVATEAYLGTSRFRTSVRRHARLVDYFMHDGSNARAWVYFEIDDSADGAVLYGPTSNRPGTTLVTTNRQFDTYIEPARLEDAMGSGSLVFELMEDLTLYTAHNQINFYTWSEEQCCLPKGATRATLIDNPDNRLRLLPGDILLLEEILGPDTGSPADANPRHRQAVRLTKVEPAAVVREGGLARDPGQIVHDELTGQAVVDIEWDDADALEFPLCLSGVSDLEHGQVPLEKVSAAKGNIGLTDHGHTLSRLSGSNLESAGEVLPEPGGKRYRPKLEQGPLTQQGQIPNPVQSASLRALSPFIPFDKKASAAAAQQWEMKDVHPAIYLKEKVSGNEDQTWLPRRDLLNSLASSNEFVVETEEEGQAYLRFGDNELGRLPSSGTSLEAYYRIGSGAAGNVGAGTITHLISNQQGIIKMYNPLPARGGVDPQPLEEVRLFAPQAFRSQQRAVTTADYVKQAESHPEVQKAAATLRWTGSWHTFFVTIDRKKGLPVDAVFKTKMLDNLQRFRVAGYEVEINGPLFVPLDIALTVCVKSGYLRSEVKKNLLAVFSNREGKSGRNGFFHPDNFTFGQPVYLSLIYQAALSVPGVDSVEVTRFERWGRGANEELKNGVLTTGKLEIVRLDNDPNFAENGRIEIRMAGGL